MAGTAVIGALRVDLGLESAQFTAGLTAAERRVAMAGQNFKRQTKEMETAGYQFGNAIGTMTRGLASFAAGFGIIGIASMAKQVLDFADDLGTAADQAGIGVERYQTLKEALRSLEVDADKADKVFKTLQDTLGKVQSGVSDGATKALDRLGISAKITAGQITTSDQLLDALAESSKRAGSAAQFTSDIVDVFGKKVGVDLAAALRDGGAALHDAEAAFRATGSVITEEMIQKLADANEKIDQFKARAGNNIVIWAAGAITNFEKVGNFLDTLSAKFARLRGDSASLAMFEGRIADFERRGATAEAQQAQRWKVAEARAHVVVQLNRRNSMGLGNAGVNDAIKTLRSETEALNKLTGNYKANTAAKAENAAVEPAPIFGKSATAAKASGSGAKTPKVAKAEVDELAKAIQQAKIDINNFSLMSMSDIIDQAQAAEAAMNKTRESSGLGALIDASDKKRDEAADARDGIRDQMTEFRDSFRESFSEGVKAAMDGDLKGFFKNWIADRAAKGMEQGLNTIADFLFNLFKQAGAQAGGSAGGGGILGAIGSIVGAAGKVFGGGSDFQQTGVGDFKAMDPWAAGSTGFATGGSFRVGGRAGVDQNLVKFRATKGEMVNITKGNNDNGRIAHIVPSPYFNVVVDNRAAGVAAPMAQQAAVGGAMMGEQRIMKRRQRSLA